VQPRVSKDATVPSSTGYVHPDFKHGPLRWRKNGRCRAELVPSVSFRYPQVYPLDLSVLCVQPMDLVVQNRSRVPQLRPSQDFWCEYLIFAWAADQPRRTDGTRRPLCAAPHDPIGLAPPAP
jgi:hypothetical protein